MFQIHCLGTIFENISAIVFDKDGTLADSRVFLRNLGQRRARLIDAQVPGVQEPLLMAFGIEGDVLSPAGLLSVGTRQENEIAAAAYVAETGRSWVDALHIATSAFSEADEYMQRKADHTPLFPGIVDALGRLTRAEIKLAILSSDTTDNVIDFAQRYGLEPYFNELQGSDRHLSKRDPLLLQQLCQRLHVLPNETLVIGDSALDAEIANSVGAAGCVGVTWGWDGSQDLKQADVVIDEFDQIQVVE